MVGAADNCNLVVDKKKFVRVSKKKNIKKPWFDSECKTARQKYLHDKNYYRRIKSLESYDCLVSSSRAYKKNH